MKGKIERIAIEGRDCEIYLPKATKGMPLTFCAMQDIADVVEEMEKQHLPACVLFALCDVDWDRDFSPWPALNRFSGGAGETMAFAEKAFSQLEERYETQNRFVIGYSLGGLFAVYCLFSGMTLQGAASVSGSMWYPNLMEFIEKLPLPRGKCYLSLGKQEAKIHSREMANNAETAQEIASLFGEKGIFEWNNGNHFYEVPKRVVKAAKFLLL